MKDSLFEDDLMEAADADSMNYDRTSVFGMRHSIRPRKMRKVVATSKPAPVAKAELPKSTPVAQDPAVAQVSVVEKPAPQDPVVTAAQEPVLAAPARLPGWDDLHRVDPGSRKSARSAIPVVDMERDTLSNRAFDLLRTRLRQTTQEKRWVNIGVSAPTTGCGTTFTAVNLALSLSRVPASRTVLMDMNLRDPGVMDALDITAPGDMADYLHGTVAMTEHLMRISDTLALGLSGEPDDRAAEILQHSTTSETLSMMRQSLTPELVIYDLPPMLVSDDVSAFLPELDGVLLVSDGKQSTATQLLECERMLDGKVPLLGVVLNRARASSIPRYS